MLFKIIGFAFVCLAGWGCGVYKSAELKEKKNNMEKFISGLDELYADIRMGKSEAFPIVKKVYSKYSFLKICDISVKAKSESFFKDDRNTVDEFFEGLGKSDRTGECERIKTYKKIFEERLTVISEEYKNKSKVWQTLGAGLGITLGLLMI